MAEWQSNAQWSLEVCCGDRGDGITTDEHRTEAEALAVCDMLERQGFGGERKHFPIRTWVSRVDE